jgi:hypothetical protein
MTVCKVSNNWKNCQQNVDEMKAMCEKYHVRCREFWPSPKEEKYLKGHIRYLILTRQGLDTNGNPIPGYDRFDGRFETYEKDLLGKEPFTFNYPNSKS